MDEGAECRQLCDNVFAFCQIFHGSSPDLPAGFALIFQHAGVLQNKRHVGAGIRQRRGVLHLVCKDLQVEAEIIVGQFGNIFGNLWFSKLPCIGREPIERILMPVKLLARPAQQAEGFELFQFRLHISLCEVQKPDNCMRPARAFGNRLYPGDFIGVPVWRPVGLHVDRLCDARTIDVRKIFVDWVVAFDIRIGPENARTFRP